MHDLVIRNATIITAERSLRGDLAIDGERIAALGDDLEAHETIDASGCYLIPGGVDQHVHLQLPLSGRVSSDSFTSGTIAAALGGTTTVIDFVTPEPQQSLLDALAARRGEADGNVAVDYGLHMTIPSWHGAAPERLREIPDAIAQGCATFKMYQAYAGMALEDADLFRSMKAVAEAGGSVVLHSEPGSLLEALRAEALAQGRIAPIEHERTRPAALEATAVARAAQIAALARCSLLIFHVGCRESVEAIAAAQRAGINVWGESCPHYLLLTAEEHLGGNDGARYICAPPLRHPADQAALWEALANNTLNVISTDHCPWMLAEKEQPDFTQIPGGVPGIEARIALMHHYGVRAGHLSLERWVALCCTNPAGRMGLAGKGAIAPGMDADLVVFDPAREVTLSRPGAHSTLHEAADWTPYEGMIVQGWTRDVILRGRAIVRDGEYNGGSPAGRYLVRRAAQ